MAYKYFVFLKSLQSNFIHYSDADRVINLTKDVEVDKFI